MSEETKKKKAAKAEKVTAQDLKEETAEENKEAAEESKPVQEENTNEAGKEKAEQTSEANDKCKAKVDELNDKIMRQMAEFENFRKRTEKEKEQMFEIGAKSVIEKILPIVDNFERGLAAIPEEDKEGKFAEGMQMIYKQLIQELEKLEVKPIEAVGKEFDPNLHNAVMQTESEEYESGVVAQELLKGYTYRNQVVRHSMVSVVQ